MNQIIDKDDFTETDTGKREWIILADLKLDGNSDTEQPCDSQTDINIAEDWSFKSTEQIGNMPLWTDQPKKIAVIEETNATPVPIEIDKMNYNQGAAFNIIKDHFLDSNNNQLFMIITGLHGSGESFVI